MTLAVSIAQSGSNNITFRNRIINGACIVAQRGNSFTYTNAVFPVDRFIGTCFGTVPASTISQSSVAPAGFINSILLSITTGQSLSSTDMHTISQNIEGFNLSDFAYGTSSAVTSTLSFWVRTSLIGNYTVAIYNPLSGKWYSQPYTVNAANTWEYKTITVVGDSVSAMNTNTSSGLRVDWVMGGGSAYNGAASQNWSSSTPRQITGSQNITATTGATFYITGAQLEAGTSASAFENRMNELQLCQRYYVEVARGSLGANIGGGYWFNSSQVNGQITFPVTMRTAPSLNATSGTNYYGIDYNNGSYGSITGWTIYRPTPYSAMIYCGGLSGITGYSGELFNNNIACAIGFSAEM